MLENEFSVNVCAFVATLFTFRIYAGIEVGFPASNCNVFGTACTTAVSSDIFYLGEFGASKIGVGKITGEFLQPQ
jgi:hypothetical protein